MRWSVLLSQRLWLAALMGFASGLPLLLTLTVLQAWLTQAEVSLTQIGLLGLVGLPYNVKFLWAPLLDRFKPLPMGRRRGWLIIAQFSLIASIMFLGTQDPGQGIWGVALAAWLVTLFSATQDVVIDAYRRETLADAEQGLGASFYTYGYRLGMMLASAGGLMLADIIGFRGVYMFMAGVMAAAMIVTLIAPEPAVAEGRPHTFREAVVGPFAEFLTRHGDAAKALLVLAFIVLYKIGDNLADHMSIPFYLNIGFTNTEVAAVVKVFGVGPLLVGVFLGGVMVFRMGLFRSMLAIGVLQSLSTACFVVLAQTGDDLRLLAAVIGFENLAIGMGSAALLAFMALCTNRQFTATQFALLSALTAVPRVLLSAPSGWFAEHLGWTQFFIVCALAAIPGLVLLFVLRSWFDDHDAQPAGASSGTEATAAPRQA